MDIVKGQRVYWILVNADGTIAQQNGIGLLTVGLAASVYTITMPANFTVPVNRREIKLTAKAAVAAQIVYDEAGSTNATVVVRTFQGAQVATNTAFTLSIFRILDEIGMGAG